MRRKLETVHTFEKLRPAEVDQFTPLISILIKMKLVRILLDPYWWDRGSTGSCGKIEKVFFVVV